MTGVQTCDLDRKSTRLNSSHTIISYAVFCLKKKKAEVRTRDTAAAGGPRGGLQTPRARPVACTAVWTAALSHDSASRASCWSFFFFNDTATTEIYTLSLHDALPI